MIPLRVQFYWRANWSSAAYTVVPVSAWGVGWSSHPGATLHQPVQLQTGVGRSNQDRLKSLVPDCTANCPWVTCPLCVVLSPVPLVNCFIVSLLRFYYGYCMQSGFSFLVLSLPPGDVKCLLPWVDSPSLSWCHLWCPFLQGVEAEPTTFSTMAPHSSTLVWRIPWMEEPGGLLSMGLHRVRHDWSDLAAVAAWRGKSKVVNDNVKVPAA